MACILANALRHVQRLAQAATFVAVLIDPGNRRARIETTSQIGWFNLAEPALRPASRRKEPPAENGASRRRDVGATIAPRRKPDGLARELSRRISTIGQSDWLDNDDSSGAAGGACAIAGMERSQASCHLFRFEFGRVATRESVHANTAILLHASHLLRIVDDRAAKRTAKP
jgi:hypothetical protein